MTITLADLQGAGGERPSPTSPGQSGATPDASVGLSFMEPWERDEYEKLTQSREPRYRTAHITAKRLAEEAAAYLVPNPDDSLTLRAIYLQRAQASALASLALSHAFAS